MRELEFPDRYDKMLPSVEQQALPDTQMISHTLDGLDSE